MKMTWVATGALVAAAAMAFPAGSFAEGRRGDVFGGRDGRGSSRDAGFGFGDTYRIGHDKGLADGLKRAEKARSRGDQGLMRDSKYRKGDAGYKKSFGPKQDYIAGYRDGYEQAFLNGSRSADTRGRGLGRGRNGRADRNDPYGYGRDGRYGRRDRSNTDPYERDGRYGTDPYERDDRYEDRDDDDSHGRDDRFGRDRDDDDYQEDGVIYEEPSGRW